MGRTLRSCTALCIAASLLVGGLGMSAVAARGTLDQSYEAIYGLATGSNYTSLAQTFTAGTTGDLDAVELAVSVYYVSTAKVEIQTVVDGKPSGTVLASAIQVLSGSADWKEVTFTSPAPVVAGGQYAIVLKPPTPMWFFNNAPGYPGGEGLGTSYTGIDFGFKTYVTAVADTTPPVTSVTGVSDGATYLLGAVPAAGCSTIDADSGVAVEATVTTGYSGGVGPATVTCSGAVDEAGNVGSAASVTFTVVYDFAGPYQPVNSLPTVNTLKAGAAVPVRFGLAGDHGLGILAAGYPVSTRIACDTSEPQDAIEETLNAGGSGLTYDALSDTYTYVWKTSKTWANSCRALVVQLDDGTQHVADFMFK